MDLDGIDASKCEGESRLACVQKAQDAVLQAKYAVLANISDSEAMAIMNTVQSKLNTFNNPSLYPSKIRMYPPEAEPIVESLDQVTKILTLRVW